MKFQRLLEAEVGVTRNEPVQLAVTEAIEKAVEGLVIEGLEDGLWDIKEGEDPLEVAAKQLINDKVDILHTIGGDDTNITASNFSNGSASGAVK